jgi:hypothetical protein
MKFFHSNRKILMAADEMKADLSRLRTYINQGKIKKLKHLLSGSSKRLNYFFEQQFDACAYATKFQQENILRLLHDYGKFLDLLLHHLKIIFNL